MLNIIYSQRITILNRLSAADSPTKLDVWKKTVLDDAAWYAKSERKMGSTEVLIGKFFKIMIPFHKEYDDYIQWKTHLNGYTMSSGDYIILGDIEESEITKDNITAIIKKYKPNVCKVAVVEPLHDRFGAFVQLYIEGV